MLRRHYQLILYSCLRVGRGSVFDIVRCGSLYGKYNKLPMYQDAIRRELEHSGDDEDYLSDLDEKFRDLSSEEGNGVNQFKTDFICR
jgi:hypothetical protein